MAKETSDKKIIANNKEARFRFQIMDTYEAGLVLQGTEVKSLRNGKAAMSDSFAYIKNGQAYLSHLHISVYTHGNRENHEPMRERKLLLHKEEIIKMQHAIEREGMTIVPTLLYFLKGRVKIELGIAKGKKTHDKHATIKERDAKKELAKVTKRSAK